MVSSATPTVIRMLVPPKGKAWMFQIERKTDGSSAIVARNKEPGNVIRFSTPDRYWAVGLPGRIPGMKPPYLRMSSAVRYGSNAMAV